MTARERYLCVIADDRLRQADAVVLLEGDGLERIPEAARLYHEGWAPLVVISGGIDNPPHSIPASLMRPALVAAGVPDAAILVEERSRHTRDQAVEITRITVERGWSSIILVASYYHQFRAFLTFLKVLEEEHLDRSLVVINAPVRHQAWFASLGRGRQVDLLNSEFERIERYGAVGHVASYESALGYQEWKDGVSR